MTPEKILAQELTGQELLRQFKEALPVAIREKFITREEVTKALGDEHEKMLLTTRVLRWYALNKM